MNYRTEKDTMGEVNVPLDKYWAAQTQRSIENFKIGNEKMPLEVVYGFAHLKKACALVNHDLGRLDADKSSAIVKACGSVLAGELDDNFPLVVWQTGSGTQSNMNMNEVVANRATEILDGDFHKENLVHPNDDVNKGQSSNDTYPTAMRIAEVVDISSFYKETGMFTFDVGYTSTASCKSNITFVDGEKGELRYRGIAIEELANNHSYLESCYLLLNGDLPTPEQLLDFDLELRHRSFIDENLHHLIQSFPDSAHPMSILASGVSALSSFYYEHLDMANEQECQDMARRIIAKIPTLAAFAYRKSLGIPFIYPDLNDEYFIKRNLYPNIDFYSGVILTALKIERPMFTAIFVIGRTVGWITQLMEFRNDPSSKIARPRQLYLGE